MLSGAMKNPMDHMIIKQGAATHGSDKATLMMHAASIGDVAPDPMPHEDIESDGSPGPALPYM